MAAERTASGELSTRLVALEKDLVGDLKIRMEGPVAEQIDRAVKGSTSPTPTRSSSSAPRRSRSSPPSPTAAGAGRAKDAGPAGDALSRMVQKLRELDVSGVDPNERRPDRPPARREERRSRNMSTSRRRVRGQVDRIHERAGAAQDPAADRHRPPRQAVRCEPRYFRMLEVYIAAGRAKLRRRTRPRSRSWQPRSRSRTT